MVVKIIQVIERDKFMEDLAKEKMRSEGYSFPIFTISRLEPDEKATEFRNYPVRFQQTLITWILNHFKKFEECKGAIEFIDLASKYLEELATVLDEMLPLFPPSYNIFEFFLKNYHTNFYTQLLCNFANQPDNISPGDIIELGKKI